MIKISKMGNNLCPEDKDIEGMYKISGQVFRIDKNLDDKWECSIYFPLKDLEHISFELNVEVEEQYNKELESLDDIKPEDIRF